MYISIQYIAIFWYSCVASTNKHSTYANLSTCVAATASCLCG